MIKKLLINVVMAGLLFLLIIFTVLDGNMTELNIKDTTFVVGFVMLSVGLLSITNIGSMFRGFGFAFKKFFFRKYHTVDYYEYSKQRDEIRKANERSSGFPAILVGVVLIIVSLVIYN